MPLSRPLKRRNSAHGNAMGGSLLFLVVISSLGPLQARAECPVGIPVGMLLEWRAFFDSGRVERIFEHFSYVGPRDGRPSWLSITRDEDGITVSTSEYACESGQLVATSDRDYLSGSSLRYHPGLSFFPSFDSMTGVSPTGTWTLGTTQVSERLDDHIFTAYWHASWSRTHEIEELSVAAGLFRSYQVEQLYRQYGPDGSLGYQHRLTRWFAVGAELFPLRVELTIWDGQSWERSVYMELISFQRLSQGS